MTIATQRMWGMAVMDGKTKKEMRERAKSLLHSSGNISEQDTEFLLGLFSLHPKHHERVTEHGAVTGFARQPDDWGSCHFSTIHEDGSVVGFSYHSCLDPNPLRKAVLDAMRNSIRYQRKAFADEAFGESSHVRCAITGVPVSRSECHVDHAAPDTFKNLVSRFCVHKGYDLERLPTVKTGPTGTEGDMLEQPYLGEWQAFHKEFARLRVTTAQANLRARG